MATVLVDQESHHGPQMPSSTPPVTHVHVHVVHTTANVNDKKFKGITNRNRSEGCNNTKDSWQGSSSIGRSISCSKNSTLDSATTRHTANTPSCFSDTMSAACTDTSISSDVTTTSTTADGYVTKNDMHVYLHGDQEATTSFKSCSMQEPHCLKKEHSSTLHDKEKNDQIHHISESQQHHQSQSSQRPKSAQQDLDWSFLKNGYLFDREEEQKQLLSSFYRTNLNSNSIELNTKKEFVLVSGLSGTGKTALVEATLKDIVTNHQAGNGYFLSGKLDQWNNSQCNHTSSKSPPQRPYAPFVAAFSNFVDLVLKKNNNEVERIRELTCSSMSKGDIDLLLETFSSLTRIIQPTHEGQQEHQCRDESTNTERGPLYSQKKTAATTYPKNIIQSRRKQQQQCKSNSTNINNTSSSIETQATTTHDRQKQLARVVRTFLKSVCDPRTRPVVLLIDDLQWADPGTLVLLHSLLLTDSESKLQAQTSRKIENYELRNEFTKTTESNGSIHSPSGLLLVGTCRHNEVELDHDLAKLLRTLEDEDNVTIRQIEVSNLSRSVCKELVANVLGIPTDHSEWKDSLDPLVDIAYDQTKGNVFFLLQFLRSLHDEGYLQAQQRPRAISSQVIRRTTTIETAQTQAEKCSKTIIKSSLPAAAEDSCSSSTNSLDRQRQLSSSLETSWLWNEDAIRCSALHGVAHTSQDAVSILAYLMRRLPSDVQETLKVASCLGSEFSAKLLLRAMPNRSNQHLSMMGYAYCPGLLSESLDLMIEKELVRMNTGSGSFRFCHDKIQQAAAALIQDDQRDVFYTNVGRRLLGHAQRQADTNSNYSDDADYCIFLIVNLLLHGLSANIINDKAEKKMVASILLEAGELAIGMGDFVTAATYLDLGIKCLKSNFVDVQNGYWRDEYDFSLAIFSAAAEVEYCTANFERMDNLIKEILLNAKNLRDKMRAYFAMINSLGSRERLCEAIAQGFSLLEVLGERFPKRTNKMFLFLDLMKTKRMVKSSFGIYSDIGQVPLMQNENKLAAMRILNLIYPYCIVLKHPKAPFACFRMVQLSLKYGFTSTSATGFSGYGFILCAMGELINGNRNGRLAVSLVDHFDDRQLVPRVTAVYYGYIKSWTTPLRFVLEPLMECHKMAFCTGDIEFALVNASLWAANAFHAGLPLDQMEAEVSKFVTVAIKFRQTSCTSVITPLLQQIYNLQANDSSNTSINQQQIPWILTGKACDEERLMGEALLSNNILCVAAFHFRKLWLAYVFHNYEFAFEMARKCYITMKSNPAAFTVFSYKFFESMTCLALAADATTKNKRKKFTKIATRSLQFMKKHAIHCKANCQNKVLMVEAEFRIAKGDLNGGLELFEKSASFAEGEGLVHEQALAYERAGLTVLKHAQTLKNRRSLSDAQNVYRDANDYFEKSVELYRLWGAIAKVDHLIAEGYVTRSRPDAFRRVAYLTNITEGHAT